MSHPTPTPARIVFASLLAAGIATTSGGAIAAEKDKEQCFGIAKAGQNDCGGKYLKHSCAGMSKADYDKNDWKYVDKGTCEKMGGSTKAAGESGKKKS